MQDYEIQTSIGTGSFGEVFLARHRHTGRTFVIKKLKVKDLNSKDRENIETEIKCLRDFKHVNIVSYKDSFIDASGVLNIVMQYCEEGDMYCRIRGTQGRKFQQHQIIDWTVQMCLAIHYMHERRILHRDLKTQNIFLTNGKVKLGDFGISKVLDSTVQLTSTVIGTPYYMSPEQFKYKPYSYKTDIWALGCVIYEMCSLRHAFDAQSMNALAVKVLKGTFSPISSNYSKGLRQLVGKMLSVNPRERPTVVQVLKSPILRKRLVSYIQSCIKEPPSEFDNIDSLIDQAEKLGVPLTQEIPAVIVSASQQNVIPVSVKVTESVRTSSKEKQPASRVISRCESQQRIHERRLSSKEQSKRRDKSMIEDDSRRQQEIKKSEEVKMIEKRNELLQRERQKRKRLASQERMRRNASSQKKLNRQESLPLLCDTDSKRKIEAPVSVPLVNRPKTKLPEIASSSGGIPPPPSIHSQTPQSQPFSQEVLTPKAYVSTQSKPSAQIASKKPFKMQEQYDMNFEQQEQQQYAPVIEQHNEEDDVQLPEKELLTEKPAIIEKEIVKSKAEEIKPVEKPAPVPAVPEKKIDIKVVVEPKQKPSIRQEKDKSSTNILKSHVQLAANVSPNSSHSLLKADSFKQKEQKRGSSAALNDSDSPNRKPQPTRTELEYSNSSGQDKTVSISNLSKPKLMEELKAPTNPKYLNVQKRIQSLKSRSETTLGSKPYNELYALIRNSGQSDTSSLRTRILGIIEQKQIVHWHFLQQILELESALKEIPPYLC